MAAKKINGKGKAGKVPDSPDMGGEGGFESPLPFPVSPEKQKLFDGLKTKLDIENEIRDSYGRILFTREPVEVLICILKELVRARLLRYEDGRK